MPGIILQRSGKILILASGAWLLILINTAERTKTMGIFTDDLPTLPSESNSDKCIGKVYLNDLKGVYIELDKSLTPRELNEILFIEHRVAETKSKDT